MAKKKSSKKKPGTRRRKRVGSMTGKLANRQISVGLYDILFGVGGLLANFLIVNPLVNKINDAMVKGDAAKSPMLGQYQGAILNLAKTLGLAFSAYQFKTLPKEARIAIIGAALGGGLESVVGFLPAEYKDKFALAGTGDMYLSGTGDMYLGTTQLLEIPMRAGSADIDNVSESVIPVFGTGDASVSDLVTF
jgi:uncharacterized membrane protein YfcA